MREKTQDEIGKMFIDIAKYTSTAILVTSFLGEFKQKWLVYTTAVVLVCIFVFIGIRILNKNHKNK